MERPIRISIVAFLLHYSISYLPRVKSMSDCGGVQNRYVCDITNSQTFHICLGANTHSFVCPSTLHFNADRQICDWPESTMCPYDNYSGQDGSDNYNNDETSNAIYNGASQSFSHETSSSTSRSQIRVNPYAGFHNKPKYHRYDADYDDDSVNVITRKSVSPTNSPKHIRNTMIKGKRRQAATLHGHINDKPPQNDNDDGGEMVKNDIYTNRITNKYKDRNVEKHGDVGAGVKIIDKKRKSFMNSSGHNDDIIISSPDWYITSINANSRYNNRVQKYDNTRKQNDVVIDETREHIIIDSYNVPKRPRKGRRKFRTAPSRGNTQSDTQSVNHRTRPRSHSPYAPPSEAYNIYPYLKRELNRNSKSVNHHAPRKYAEQEKNTQNQLLKISHRNWYQKPHIFKVLNKLENINVITKHGDPESRNSSKFIGGEFSVLERRKQSPQKTRKTPSWIEVFAESGKNHLNVEEIVNGPENIKDNSNRINHNNEIEKSTRALLLSQVDSNIKKKVKQIKNRLHNDASKHSIKQSTSHQSNSFFRESKSKDFIPDNKKSWTMSELTKSNQRVPHPRIRPYRPWPLSKLIGDSNKVIQKGETTITQKQSPKAKMSTSKSSSVVSFNGNIIHPYKPKHSKTSDISTLSKSGKSYHYSVKKTPRMSRKSKRRGECSSLWCQLPECRCPGPDIPGGLSRDDVPMMVMLTFDDGVNQANFPFFKQMFDGNLRNPNGCPIKSTFFVSGDNTDYKFVKQLYKDGHEIASHTLSHRSPTTWWSHAGLANWEKEIVGMKNRLAEKSDIPRDSIQGMRAPFLQIGGDDQYTMLYNHKFRFDSSMVTGTMYKDHRPPIWPFTLDTPPDYRTCNLPPCPTESYPGLWEIPLIRWYSNDGTACAMADSCYSGSGHGGTVSLLENNFQHHNKSNKAPLGIFIHASWFQRQSGSFEGLNDFLLSILKHKDVWLLTASQVLDWIEHPVPKSSLANLKSWQC